MKPTYEIWLRDPILRTRRLRATRIELEAGVAYVDCVAPWAGRLAIPLGNILMWRWQELPAQQELP